MRAILLAVAALSLHAGLLVDGGRHRKRARNPGRCFPPARCPHGREAPEQEPSPLDVICPPCEKIHCKPKNPSKLKCKGGFSKDVCGCCPRCAKVEGEQCGGKNGYLGHCDVGLFCEAEPPSPYHVMRTSAPLTEMTSRSFDGMNEGRGRCRPVEGKPLDQEPDTAEVCEQECTPEFCLSNPRSLCSARNSALVSQDCQGRCQHTACGACFFQEEPPCPKCRKDDVPCIMSFARCTKKKSTCSRNKYPCKKTRKPQEGKFLCWVPKCL